MVSYELPSPFLLASGSPSLEWQRKRHDKGWACHLSVVRACPLTVWSPFYWEFGQCSPNVITSWIPWVVLHPKDDLGPEQTVRGQPLLYTGKGSVFRRYLLPVWPWALTPVWWRGELGEGLKPLLGKASTHHPCCKPQREVVYPVGSSFCQSSSPHGPVEGLSWSHIWMWGPRLTAKAINSNYVLRTYILWG